MNTHPIQALLLLLSAALSLPRQVHAAQVINTGPRLSVVQGDRARLSAQFFDAEGNSGLTISAINENDQVIGEISRNNNTGDLEWNCDTAGIPAGTSRVVLVATDTAGASARVPFSLEVTPASSAQHWRQTYFGSSQAAGSALDNADPDGDGLSNLAEFAFGLNPTRAGGDLAARVEPAADPQGGMHAVFRRRKDRVSAGLSYVVEFSSDLSEWVPGAATPGILGDDGDIELATLPFPILPNGRQSSFFRVQVLTDSP